MNSFNNNYFINNEHGTTRRLYLENCVFYIQCPVCLRCSRPWKIGPTLVAFKGKPQQNPYLYFLKDHYTQQFNF